MPKIRSFEDLPVWIDARKFTNKVYKLTNKFPKNELYGLSSQIRRATVSIMSNIAEGFDRYSVREFINFLIIERGSNSEVQNDCYIAFDLEYINKEEFEEIYKLSRSIGKQINGLIKYLRTKENYFAKNKIV